MNDESSLEFALHNYLFSHGAQPEVADHEAEPEAAANVFYDIDFGDDEYDIDFGDDEQKDEEMVDNDDKDDEDEKNEEQQEEDVAFENEQNAEETITTAFKVLKEQFGDDTARDVIIKCAVAAEITLFKTKPREGTAAISTINIDEIRRKVQRFPAANLDSNIRLKPTDTVDNILDNCVVVNQKIISVESAKEIAQVRSFGYYHQLHNNIEAAKACAADYKDFLSKLKGRLELKSAAQVSKLRRKVKRVQQLVDTVGTPGAYILAMYITVHCLENEKDDNWKQIIDAIVDNTEYMAFSMTLVLDVDGVTPLLGNQ